MTSWPERAFCGVAVMAKASEAGRTKTRLCPPLTFEDAAEFNTAFLKDVAANLAAASKVASIAGSMAFGPPKSEAFFRAHVSASLPLHEVWLPDFGSCLQEALRLQFEAGHRAACVLNSDSPTLPVALLAEMVEILKEPIERIVLGPSTDGGYYLLACKTIHSRLFQDISWSTEAVAAQTLERAREIGIPIHILPAWYDVDDCASIRLLMGELLEGQPFSQKLKSSPALHSLALLRPLIANTGFKQRLESFEAAAGALPEAVA